MSLMLGLPVLAETNTNVVVSKKSETSATKIECVGRAIATRESSLASAFNTHSEKVSAAYATRANELSGAYTNNTVKATQLRRQKLIGKQIKILFGLILKNLQLYVRLKLEFQIPPILLLNFKVFWNFLE